MTDPISFRKPLDETITENEIKDKTGTGDYPDIQVENVARTIKYDFRAGYRPTGFENVSGQGKYQLPKGFDEGQGIKWNAYEPFDETKRLKKYVGTPTNFKVKDCLESQIPEKDITLVNFAGRNKGLRPDHAPFKYPDVGVDYTDKNNPISYKIVNEENRRWTAGKMEVPEMGVEGSMRVNQREPDKMVRNEPRRGAGTGGFGNGGLNQRDPKLNAGKFPAKYANPMGTF